jgi:trigger factor
MKITELKKDGLTQTYQVVVDKAQMDAEVDKQLVKLAPKVKMDGFRAGKVPMAVLKKRYGPSTWSDAVNDTIQKGVDRVLKDNKIVPVLQPEVSVEKADESSDLIFTVSVEKTPEVEPKSYDKIKVEKLKVKIDESEVKDRMNEIIKNQFTSEPVKESRATKNGDVVVIDFEGKLESGKVIDGGSGTDFSLELGSNTFIPGFEDQLLDVNVGITVEVKVPFPKAYHEKSIAGKPAIFTVTVKAIHEKTPAKLDDVFAKKIGLESLDALKKIVREDIEREYDSLVRTHMKRQLLDALAADYTFDVPQGMVKGEFDAIWNQLQQALSQNSDREAVLGDDKDLSEEKLKEEYMTIAIRRVRLGLVLAEIGKRENISVSPEELREGVVQEARKYPGQEKQVFYFYSKNPQALMQLRAPLFEEKVVDHIFKAVKVLETDIDAKDVIDKVESF